VSWIPILCHIFFICVVGIVVGKQIFVVGNNPVIVILWKDYVVGRIFYISKITYLSQIRQDFLIRITGINSKNYLRIMLHGEN
tara:strand:- start:187 stop:435 length:249 start_codon:yes stop_codon:yes gene_type:complete